MTQQNEIKQAYDNFLRLGALHDLHVKLTGF